MKSLRRPVADRGPAASHRSTARFGIALFSLAAFFWFLLLSAGQGREASATELIAAGLSGKHTLQSASKAEFLAAVCSAARDHRAAAAGIASVAVAAHREWTGEIVGAVLRCGGKLDCEFVGSIVRAASTVEGVTTDSISDAALAKASNCAETIRDAIKRGVKESAARADSADGEDSGALIGTSAGPDEGFDPHEPLQLVCDHGTRRAVRTSQLDEFLRTNPGSFVGPCSTSPEPKAAPSAAPTVAPALTPSR